MAGELCALSDYRHIDRFTVEDLVARERPGRLEDVFCRAREWQVNNPFIGGVNYLKGGYVNYGLTLKCATPGQSEAFRTWLDTDDGLTRMDVEKYIGSTIAEWLTMDNLVSFWREEGKFPFPLPVERCRYTDALGQPILHARLAIDPKDLVGSGFTKEQRERYAKGEIKLDEHFGEHFLVLTRTPRGRGFGPPRMKQVFHTASQSESMEVGESLVAYAGRCLLRLHHLGWEVKQNSGVRQVDAMWDKARATDIEKDFHDGNMMGVKNATLNFDHQISHQWALNDLKLDGKHWASITQRMQWYGGPLATILLSKNLNPDLLPMLMAEISWLRDELRGHLQYVLNQSMHPPGGIKLAWGNKCFTNPKLFWEMLKNLMQQGPLPLKAALEAADVDPDQAASDKLAEANDAEGDKKFLPKLQPAGNAKKLGAEKPPGRTDGVRDGEGK